MVRVYAALLIATASAGCASRAKHPPEAASARKPALGALAQSPEQLARHCDVPCETRSTPQVQVVLPLRSDAHALLEPASAEQLRPLGRELERLRVQLLACDVEPRPVVVLSAREGSLAVEFRGAEPAEREAECLRTVLRTGLTPGLVPHEVAVAFPDQPLSTFGQWLSKEQIRSVIRTHIADFRECLDEHVDPSLYQVVPLHYTVHFRVDSAGEVRCVEAQNRDPALAPFACCFVPRLRQWRFPTLAEGRSMDVNYPFVVGIAPEP